MKNYSRPSGCTIPDADVACRGLAEILAAELERSTCPARIERERYFAELGIYLELSALFTGPLKPARWRSVERHRARGLDVRLNRAVRDDASPKLRDHHRAAASCS